MKHRRLGDLYVRGRELAPSDGEGEPVKVWLAKLNEIDREAALRRANAAKARFMIDADNEDGDLFAAAYAEFRVIEERDEVMAFVIAEDVGKARRRIEAQHALDEETWGKDDYLQGLVDSWYGGDESQPGLSSVYEEDPEDPEAKRVLGELERFRQLVNAEVESDTARLMMDYEGVSIDSLWRKGAHRILELRANDAFAREYRRQQLFFALRDPVNRRMRYFERVSEIDDLDDDLRDYLFEQYEDLMVDRTEGKDSPPPAASSTSSVSEDQDSGLAEASA
jgi:hypothetical protein